VILALSEGSMLKMTGLPDNPHLRERLRRMDEEAAINRVRQACKRPVLIDYKQALLCGTGLGRRPKSHYVPD
jgi:hypothetical protein